MKHTLLRKSLLLLFSLVAVAAAAQETNRSLRIHLNDGTTQELPVSSIDSLTFGSLPSPDAMVLEYTVPDGGEVHLPLSGKIDLQVDWGDGSAVESIVDSFMPSPAKYYAHVYAKAGVYKVSLTGSVEQFYQVQGHDETTRSYLTAILQWGRIKGIKSMETAFRSCKKLTYIPADNNGIFADVTTFKQAFEYCTKLPSVPSSLFAGCPNVTDMYGCFANCESLTAVPDTLFYPLKNVQIFSSVLNWCSKLKSIPSKFFAKNTEATSFDNAFCFSGLEPIPSGLFKGMDKVKTFQYVFQACRKLTMVPDNLFEGCSSATDFSTAFWGDWNLVYVGADVFKGCTSATNFKWLFNGCEKLPAVPAGLFDDCTNATSFEQAFSGCKALTGESPYTMVGDAKVHLYERSAHASEFAAPTAVDGCFKDCTKLSDYATISEKYPDWVK